MAEPGAPRASDAQRRWWLRVDRGSFDRGGRPPTAALAERYGSTIQALWVVTLPRVEEEAPIPADWDEAIKLLEEQYSARLAELGEVDGRVTYGGPREELAQFAKHLDLLIVGSRNHGPVGRLVHGSVSGYLLGHASCSLLVLPRHGQDGHAAQRQ